MVTQSFEQVYQAAEAFQDLAEGLGNQAQRKLRALVEMILANEAEARGPWRGWDWAAEIYHRRTELLAEAYDVARGWAH